MREAHLEAHGDGRTSPLLLVARVEQLDLGAELAFLHAAHALDPSKKRGRRLTGSCDKHQILLQRFSHSLPHDGVLARLVLGLALHADHLHVARVEWCRDFHLRTTLTSDACTGVLPCYCDQNEPRLSARAATV